MSNQSNPEQIRQSIFENVQARNISVENITQIVNLSDFPKPTAIPCNIPHSATVKFVGRAEVLERLHQLLQQNDRVVIAAIEGMGGVGKSELATQYALLHLLLLTYPAGICWLRARDEDVGIQIVSFAEVKLGLKIPENWDLAKQVDFCWSYWCEGDVLVVLDDVSDYLKVKPYLPPLPSRFKVLITTRLKLDGIVTPLTLDVLDETAALELLNDWVGAEKISGELAFAKELCQSLGYLPLALNLVGRYVNKRKLSLAEMLRRLGGRGLQHVSLDVDKHDRTLTLNIKRGVASAFELSWEDLSDNAKQLGCLLSLFSSAPIPWKLVESIDIGQDAEELEDARIELENLYLVQGKEIYRLHQLIREFFLEKLVILSQADQLKQVFTATLAEVAKKVPDTYSVTNELIHEFTAVIPHLREVAYYLTNYLNDDDIVSPFKALGFLYESQLRYAEAESLYKHCLQITQQRFGSEHHSVATSLNNLAYTYKSQGRYSEAEPLYLQALDIRKRLMGNMHTSVAHSLNNLATVYRKQRRYSEAEPLLLQALTIRKSLLGERHINVAMSLNHLGYLYYEQGRYSEAEALYLQALTVHEHLSNKNRPFKAINFDNLALLYEAQSRWTEAESLYLQALAIRQHLLGEEHPNVAVSLSNLAKLYHIQGFYVKAQTLFVQALLILERQLGLEHGETITVRNNFVTFLKEAIASGQTDLKSLPHNPTIQAILAQVEATLP